MFREFLRYFERDVVPVSPSLSFPALVTASADLSSSHFPFSQERTIYTFSGTGAIYQAATLLGLSAGDNVLCPAYNCGHEIEPFLRQSVTVKLFSVREDLQIDIDHLEGQIDQGTRAVLVTHYFGFPQKLDSVRSICDERGIFLIEDCAHGLFSRDGQRPLGTVGDLAIFSMRKSLPSPDGGALAINNPQLKWQAQLGNPPSLVIWNKVIDLHARHLRAGSARSVSSSAALAGMLPLVIARKLFRRLQLWDPLVWYDPDDETFRIDQRIYSWEMSDISERIVKGIDPDAVVVRRRRNFEYLGDALSGAESVKPVYKTLVGGVCPLYFPVVCDDPARLVQKLASKGIGAISWWGTFHQGVSWGRFEREAFLKRHVVALPVHQDLTDSHLEKLVERILK